MKLKTLLFAAMMTFSHMSVADNILYAVSLGYLNHDAKNLWSGKNKEDGYDYNLEVVFAKELFHFWDGAVRPNVGVSLNNSADTNQIYSTLVWEKTFATNWLLNLAWGISLNDGVTDSDNPKTKDEKKLLGSHILFRSAIEVGYNFNAHHALTFLFDHISNASLADKNQGLDTAGFRYRYRF